MQQFDDSQLGLGKCPQRILRSIDSNEILPITGGQDASVDNTGEYSEYRRVIVEFLKSQIGEGLSNRRRRRHWLNWPGRRYRA